MKGRAISLLAIFATTAMAGQSAIKLERAFRDGEVDNYKLALNVSIQDFGEAAIDMSLAQTVKRVYANGDADIESKPSNMVLKLNGQEMPKDAIGAGEGDMSSVQRFDKYFRPVAVPGTLPARGMMNQVNLMRYGIMLSGQELKVGETMPITYENKDTKTIITGTAKLVSVTSGIAKIESAVKVQNPETGPTKIDLKVTSEVEVATAKPIKVEGVVTDVPAQGGMAIQKIRFSMTKG